MSKCFYTFFKVSDNIEHIIDSTGHQNRSIDKIVSTCIEWLALVKAMHAENIACY